MSEISGIAKIQGVIPTTYDEIMQFAIEISRSSFVPKAFKAGDSKPEKIAADLFSAICMGLELGLSPMSAIQSIAVVNGQPAIWGDMPLALVMNSKLLVTGSFREYSNGDWDKGDYVAICESIRVGQAEPLITSFSQSDAKRAGLIGKTGTWTTHPKRMMKYKARGFNLRDNFPDVLKGLHSVEELEGETIDITPQSQAIKQTSFFDDKKSIESPQITESLGIIETPKLEDYQLDYLESLKGTIDSMDAEGLKANGSKILSEAESKLDGTHLEILRDYARGALLEKRRIIRDEQAKLPTE